MAMVVFYGSIFLFTFALAGSILVIILGMVGNLQISASPYPGSNTQSDRTDWGMPLSNLACWTPAEYTPSMDSYAHSVCQAELHGIIMQMYNKSEETTSPSPTETDEKPENREQHDRHSESKLRLSPIYLGFTNIAISCLYFLLMLNLCSVLASHGNIMYHLVGHHRAMRDVLDKITSARSIAITTMLIHVFFLLFWIFFAYGSHNHLVQIKQKNEAPSETEQDASIAAETNPLPDIKSGIFSCDFTVRMLGNIRRQTVDCAYTVNLPGSPDSRRDSFLGMPGADLVTSAIVVQLTLCSIMAVFTLIQLFYLFISGPSRIMTYILVMLQHRFANMSDKGLILKRIHSPMIRLSDFSLICLLNAHSPSVHAIQAPKSELTAGDPEQEFANIALDAEKV